MEKINNEGLLKKRITYSVAILRLFLLLVLIIFFSIGGLLPSTFFEILYCMLPLTVLYMVFSAKYVLVNKRYFYPGKTISESYFITSYVPLVAMLVAEAILIVFVQNRDILALLVVMLECLLAIYAGYFLSGLFVRQPPTAGE